MVYVILRNEIDQTHDKKGFKDHGEWNIFDKKDQH